MDEIRIIDTTLRDGNTSLWAHNMTTGMMHPVLRHMDQAGFDGMEFFVSGRFKKVVREQRDDPWDWVRYGQKGNQEYTLRYHGGSIAVSLSRLAAFRGSSSNGSCTTVSR